MFQICLIIVSIQYMIADSNKDPFDKENKQILREVMKNSSEKNVNKIIGISTKFTDILPDKSVKDRSSEGVTVKNCGLSNSVDKSSFGNRIVGGKVSRLGEHPWAVMLNINLTQNRRALCGGSLINENWVLTAAHCVSMGKGSTIKALEALVGVQHREKLDKNTQKRLADCVIPHPNYKGIELEFANDLALIRVNKPFKITHESGGNVNGICFPPKTNPPFEYTGKARVAGWGLTFDRLLFGQPADELKHTTVSIIDNKRCLRYPYPVKIKDSMMCQGVDWTGPCQGDSGGPLIIYLDNKEPAVQIGIVSFGPGFCANFLIPNTIYTKISYFLEWIENTIKSYTEKADCPANGLRFP